MRRGAIVSGGRNKEAECGIDHRFSTIDLLLLISYHHAVTNIWFNVIHVYDAIIIRV